MSWTRPTVEWGLLPSESIESGREPFRSVEHADDTNPILVSAPTVRADTSAFDAAAQLLEHM